MRIVVGAMARSGSTWTFNAARLLAQKVHGPGKVNAADNRLFKPLPGVDVEIIKTHATDGKQLPADKIVTCLRDMRDALCSAVSADIVEVASYKRRGLKPGILDGMRLLFEAPSFYWDQHAQLYVRFERLHFEKRTILESLADYLFPGHEFEWEWLQKALVVLDLMPHVYGDVLNDEDERGFLHGQHRHVQGVGVMGHLHQLPIDDVLTIEKTFADWFKHFNYPTSDEYQDIEELLYE